MASGRAQRSSHRRPGSAGGAGVRGESGMARRGACVSLGGFEPPDRGDGESMHPTRGLLCVLCVASVAVSPPAALARTKDRGREARGLVSEGRDRYSVGSFAERRVGIEKLERAALLAPRDTRLLRELGRAYLDAGFSHAAKETFERVTKQDPADAEAWLGLGQVWKRDWLATLAPGSLARAIESYGNSARLDPGRAEAWTTLRVLRVEPGGTRGAATCARRALAADSGRAGGPPASAYLLSHTRRPAPAGGPVPVAIPRLAPRPQAPLRHASAHVPQV